MLLLRGLMTRVARGFLRRLGLRRAAAARVRPTSRAVRIADSEDSLQTFAAQQNVDILISLNMTGKATGSIRTKTAGPPSS